MEQDWPDLGKRRQTPYSYQPAIPIPSECRPMLSFHPTYKIAWELEAGKDLCQGVSNSAKEAKAAADFYMLNASLSIT